MRLLTTLGLGIEVAGVMFLAWASQLLIFRGPGTTIGGVIPPETERRIRWPTRIGWACLIAGLALQAAAVWV